LIKSKPGRPRSCGRWTPGAPPGTMPNVNPDTIAIWRLSRIGPWRQRVRLRLALVLYVAGLRQLAERIAQLER
jgi:hypothetical protein